MNRIKRSVFFMGHAGQHASLMPGYLDWVGIGQEHPKALVTFGTAH